MKIASNKFKEIVCVLNAVSSNARVSFNGHTWVSKNGKGDTFEDYDFKEIKSILIEFADDVDENDELIFNIK